MPERSKTAVRPCPWSPCGSTDCAEFGAARRGLFACDDPRAICPECGGARRSPGLVVMGSGYPYAETCRSAFHVAAGGDAA